MAGHGPALFRWSFLRTIADETGGRAILGHNNLAEPFAQIARDNGSYYLLGFRPRTPAGRTFRELRVRVKRDDVRVFARQGYGEPGGSGRNAAMRATLARAWAGKTVADLLDRPLPGATSGLPFRVAASVIARAGAKAKVLLIVELDGGALAADASQVEVGYRAISARGEAAANRVDTTRLQLSARTRAAIDTHGWRYLSTFDLAPGAYQLRVAVREAQSGSTGNVFLDLDVPDLSRQPVAIDSVLVGSSTSGATPTAAPQQALLKRWPMLPTARRAFPRSETLTAFTRIAGAAGQGMTIHIAITGGDGRRMLSASRDFDAAQLAPDAAPLELGISLAPFEPGEYTMTVSAVPKDAPARAATRSVVFRVIDAAPGALQMRGDVPSIGTRPRSREEGVVTLTRSGPSRLRSTAYFVMAAPRLAERRTGLRRSSISRSSRP